MAAAAAGAQQRSAMASGKFSAFVFVQPLAMGVLLGQGWHVYSEVFTRGSQVGFGVCCVGAAIGLLISMLLCARAALGQAALRLSLFWMACTLTGGLAGIAQLRMRVGRFKANDDALVVNSFLSSGLLGTALPHIVLKIVRQPGAEVLMPCVLAVLTTEAICSSESWPGMQVGVSFFLLAVGLQGIGSDSSLPMGSFGGEALRGGVRAAGTAATKASGAPGASDSGGAHEPFFPATAIDKRCYSPHFLVSQKSHYVPNGTSVVPLISLVVRQAAAEPSRGSGERGNKGGGKERGGKGGDRSEGRDRRSGRDRHASEEAPSTPSQPQTLPSGLDAEEAVRQKTAAAAGEVGSDVRWDVLFEEMQRVDGDKEMKRERVDSDKSDTGKKIVQQQQPVAAALDGGLEDPVEVCAELTAEAEDVGGEFPAEESEAVPLAAPTDAGRGNAPQVPLEIQQRLEQALAAARQLEAASDSATWQDEAHGQQAEDDAPVEPEQVLAKMLAQKSDGTDGAVAPKKKKGSKDRQDGSKGLSLFGDAPAAAAKPKKKSLSLFDDDPEECAAATDASKPAPTGLVLTPKAAESYEQELDDDAFEPVADSRREATELRTPGDAVSAASTKWQPNTAAQEFVPGSVPQVQVENKGLSLFGDAPTAAAKPRSSLSLFADEPESIATGEHAEEEAYTALNPLGEQAASWQDPTHSGQVEAGQDHGADGEKAWSQPFVESSWDKPWDYSFGAEGAAAWDGYAYGDMHYAGYGYGDSAGGAGAYMNMSAEASEFIPGFSGWGGAASGQEQFSGQEGATSDSAEDQKAQVPSEPRPHDPAMSLFDNEAPDPGCGRASAVRQWDAAEDRRGKGRRVGPPRSLWVGDIELRITEDYLEELFSTMAVVTHVKIIRDRGGYQQQTGFAFVEFTSHEAAVGVLEALKGEPIVGKDGKRFRVNWATERQPGENQGGDYEGWGYHSKSDGAKGSMVDAQRSDRRWKGDWGKGDDKGKGKKGADGKEAFWDGGKGGKMGKDDGKKGLKGGKGDNAGAASKSWAYLDPKGEVQVGFSMDEMRQWYELGYFKEDLQVALVQDGKGGGKSKAPHRREFFPLRKWFPELSTAFTYFPKY